MSDETKGSVVTVDAPIASPPEVQQRVADKVTRALADQLSRSLDSPFPNPPKDQRHGRPYDTPQNFPITLEELDRLQAIVDAASQVHPGYCGAHEDNKPDGCPCSILWMTPNVGFGTHRVDDVSPLTKENGEVIVMLDKGHGRIPGRDIKAFVEARNALPNLIALARKALEAGL